MNHFLWRAGSLSAGELLSHSESFKIANVNWFGSLRARPEEAV